MSFPTNDLMYHSFQEQVTPRRPALNQDFSMQSQLRPILHYEPNNIGEIRVDTLALSSAVSLEALGLGVTYFDTLSRPWLPPKAKDLLQKLRKGRISESKLIKLMEIVADRVIEHFDLPKGKFVAITFSGKIVNYLIINSIY